MQLGLAISLTEDPPQDIVYLLEGILFPGKARNDVLLFGRVQNLNIDLWL